jgi:hypothetical protein
MRRRRGRRVRVFGVLRLVLDRKVQGWSTWDAEKHQDEEEEGERDIWNDIIG